MSAARPVAPAPRRPQPSAARPAAKAAPDLRSIERRIAALEAKSAELKANVEAEGLKLRKLADTVAQAKARRTR